MNKMAISLVVVLIVIAGMVFFFYDKDGPIVKQTYTSSGEITKIVYEVTEDSPISVCQEDCVRRGGLFQECGNPCEPEAQVCETVCAVTCTISNN